MKPAGGTPGPAAPPPGSWADSLCLEGSGGAPDGLAYNQWTDVDLFFDRYVGELACAAENDSSASQLDSKAAKAQGPASQPETDAHPLPSDPTGESRFALQAQQRWACRSTLGDPHINEFVEGPDCSLHLLPFQRQLMST